jgi:UDP-glucose:(heptosyl)LPS alpha-1,3-glucosyltransferase
MVLAEAAAARLPMYISDICGYAFVAEHGSLSKVLNEKLVTQELQAALSELASKAVGLARAEPAQLVSAASRASICADQIEAWCEQ